MAYVQKPAFEQFRHEIISRGRPMLEKNTVPIQAAIIESLEQYSDLLIEKSRRLPNTDAMIEISAKWLGLDGEQDEVMSILRLTWSDEVLGANESVFHVQPADETVLMTFAAKYESERYLTGKVRITF